MAHAQMKEAGDVPDRSKEDKEKSKALADAWIKMDKAKECKTALKVPALRIGAFWSWRGSHAGGCVCLCAHSDCWLVNTGWRLGIWAGSGVKVERGIGDEGLEMSGFRSRTPSSPHLGPLHTNHPHPKTRNPNTKQ